MMDGINFILDEKENKKYLQIDLEKYDQDSIEDLLDILVARSGKNENSILLKDALDMINKEKGLSAKI